VTFQAIAELSHNDRSSYLLIALLEEKQWLPQGIKETAWEAVHNSWYDWTSADGQLESVSQG
jgi:hypothetical protein